MKNIKKNIVILGPTASGKTSLGVKLAHLYDGEIISADSRQVFRYMDIGTGKDIKEYTFKENGKTIQIPYHLIDIVDPKTEFNLVKFLHHANKSIKNIRNKKKLPLIVGGTGLYIQALVDGYELSTIKPDKKLREKLEKKDSDELLKKLHCLNADFAEKLNNSEKNNKRRLIRYIELFTNSINANPINRTSKRNNYILIGLKWDREITWERIHKRLIERIEKEDMIGEVKRLHEKHKVSWKRLMSFGLEYKYISLYLTGKLEYDEMVEKLYIAIRQFAKRQLTWFKAWEKKGAKIYWVESLDDAIKIIEKSN